MPSNWLIFDRLRAFTRQHKIYQADRIFQDQTSLDRLTAGAEFLDFNQQAAILDQTNLQINRLERYKDYEQMDQTGEISLALDLYADETSLVDPERKHTLVIRAGSSRIKKELEDLFFNILQWDNYCRPAIRYLCKYGDFPAEIVPDKNRDGVSSVKFINVYNFTRVETRYGDLVGFFYQDEFTQEPTFMHPWQVMHLRLTSFENIYHPYGRSVMDGGRKAFKQLRLMEDAALIYRITRAPEKRKFIIPVGMIPPKEVPEYMASIARQFKRQRFYNPATGTFDERYSPLIQEDDFFLPRRPDGTGPDIDVLPGAENLDQIADIEYFKKKMIAPMKIPFSRVGIGDGSGESNEKSLSQSHAEFAKAVQWIQREVASGLTKVAIVHLALRGYSADDIKKFDLALTATSAMEELYRIETWQTRVGVMADLKDLGWFPKEWIVTRFTDLSPDEIEELKDMEEMAANGGPGGGGPAGAMGIGGEEGGEEGMEGEEGGEEGEDEGEEGEDTGGLEALMGGGGAEEGLDIEAEKRIITELARQGRKKEAKKILEKWADKLGKGDKEKIEITNGYDHLIEIKELDGLTKTISENNSYDPDDPGLLVEWSVDKAERDSAISEVKRVLTGESAPITQSSVITEDDLPVDKPSS